MNQPERSISLLQTSLLIIAGIGILNHVTLIPPLLESAGRDSWMSVLVSFMIYLIWILLILYIMKIIRRQSVYLWLKQKIGAIPTVIYMTLFSIHLFFLAVVSIKEMIIWTNITYLPNTPQLVLSLLFLSICFYVAWSGLLSLAIVNGILLPFVIMFGFFVGWGNMPNKDHTLLFPVLENGFSPVIKGALYSGTGLVEVFILIFLQHKIKKKLTYRFFAINGLILMFLTLGPLTGAIMEFGPYEASAQRFPAYEEWSLLSLGRFVEHVDFLSIYQWLTGAFVRTSLIMLLIPELFHLSRGKKRNVFLLTLFAALLVMIQLPISGQDFERLIFRYFLPMSLLSFIFLTLTLFVIAYISNLTERMKTKK
ncbi:MAG: endospore germination permease [Bacillaceae bacterium]|nr:endospore germination permease [Bacillaceae bacterium]